MKYLTNKDIIVLKTIQQLKKDTKSNIARNTEYIYSGLNHTFKKLEEEDLIKINKVKHNRIVELSKKGEEVMCRI